MTFDVVFRHIVLPLIGTAALVVIVREIREFIRDYRKGLL